MGMGLLEGLTEHTVDQLVGGGVCALALVCATIVLVAMTVRNPRWWDDLF